MENDTSLGRGSIVQHEGEEWACIFQIDKYWFAAPLNQAKLTTQNGIPMGTAVECLQRPTPTQAERARLTKGVPTGIIAIDTLVPIGLGQSLIIAGPRSTGKSTLAREISDYAFTVGQFDKSFWFCTEPSTHSDGEKQKPTDACVELSVKSPFPDSQAALLTALYAVVGAAEVARNAGEHVLVVLDTLAPLLHAWNNAQQWAEAVRGELMGSGFANAQARSCFAGLFERAGYLARGGSLTLLVLVDTDEEAKPNSVQRHMIGGNSGMFRELQSLSDGQVVLDKAKANAGNFPAIVAGASFSRFGLGSNEKEGQQPQQRARDVRPAALQPVAAHLRMHLALEADSQFRPKSTSADDLQSKRMLAVQAALLQPPRAPLRPKEMVVLLLAAASGAFDSVSVGEAMRALRGGANAPLLQHIQAESPHVLQNICEDERISQNTALDLNTAVRIFLAMEQAKSATNQAGALEA